VGFDHKAYDFDWVAFWKRGERRLRHVLLSYKHYYNATRTHLFLAALSGREYRLPTDPGWTAPSIWLEVIYGKRTYCAPIMIFSMPPARR
jgi:hypothetical protein